jgi:hypothetical protein
MEISRMTVQNQADSVDRLADEDLARVSAARAWLPWLFLVYGMPMVIFLALAMPPFQVADEIGHALRADQISRGGPVFQQFGGMVDGSLAAIGHLYESMSYHQDVKQTPDLARRAGAIGWPEPDRDEVFQSPAQYGPLFYIPQAIGIWLGRSLGISPTSTLALARVMNGLAACAIGFLALSICRRGLALTFTTLLFPMALSQFASLSQDALIISLSILAVAMASRVLTEQRPASTSEFAIFAAIVVSAALARPSNIALALLAPAFVTWSDLGWRRKALIGGAAVVLLAVWFPFQATLLQWLPSEWSVSITGQLRYIFADPLAFPRALVSSLLAQYEPLLAGMVGRLGWGWTDVIFPNWYYLQAAVVFICALAAPGNSGPTLRPTLIAALTFLGFITALSGALYLSWTKVGKPTIDGLQGRYFLPVIPLLAWPVPAFGARLRRLLHPSWHLVVPFPLVTVATLPGVIMQHYYGTWSGMAASLEVLFLQ